MAIQLILQQVGALPMTVNFNALGDEQMYLEVNGTVWSQFPNHMIGIAIAIDGRQVGTAQVFSNGTATHRPCVPAYIPIQLSPGSHTLTLSVTNPTTISDSNDLYTAVIHY